MSEKKKKSKIREEKLKIKERNYVAVKRNRTPGKYTTASCVSDFSASDIRYNQPYAEVCWRWQHALQSAVQFHAADKEALNLPT